jgi:hypothetical protein
VVDEEHDDVELVTQILLEDTVIEVARLELGVLLHDLREGMQDPERRDLHVLGGDVAKAAEALRVLHGRQRGARAHSGNGSLLHDAHCLIPL